MSAKNTKKRSGTDWKRLRAMKDRDIDFSDIHKLDKVAFLKATLRFPKRKEIVSIRLDPDVLEWFKNQGHGYQTRMNAVLKMYMEGKMAGK